MGADVVTRAPLLVGCPVVGTAAPLAAISYISGVRRY